MRTSRGPFRFIEHVEIRLKDGIILSAAIWLPIDANTTPVPAILEYIPYRKRDFTAPRDALNHRYFASNGYACVRVDMRGSGESEGLLLGEYLQQEQDDCLEILSWIAAQEWCTGSIGMFGKSWGGFNGLQVAARQPPELKAVISVCSTDDRYANDIHYQGGALLTENFQWGAFMFAMSLPPDPALVGDKWRDMWLERLDRGNLFTEDWLRHQSRDRFWKHGSICEDYSQVKCPVYLVSGWQDPYQASIFRMLENLECPKKGLVGPWAHCYPNQFGPGPKIGFLQESLRWWDYWLKGIDTGIMDEPELRCYMQTIAPPRTYYDSRPGHWIAESSWPSKGVKYRKLGLATGRLLMHGATETAEKLSICSPQTVGFMGGRWVPFGADADLPGDQAQEAPGSLVFDLMLDESWDILGAPELHVRVTSDKPKAVLTAMLCEVLPDGSVTRLSYEPLNLCHRVSHENPSALEPGKYYDVVIKLRECAQHFAAGARIRLALSSAYFPMIWPSPEPVTLTIDCSHSSLQLPFRINDSLDDGLEPFETPANGVPLDLEWLRPARSSNTVTQDLNTREVVARYVADGGKWRNRENGWCSSDDQTNIYAVHPDNPLSAWAEHRFRKECGRQGFDLAIIPRATDFGLISSTSRSGNPFV